MRRAISRTVNNVKYDSSVVSYEFATHTSTVNDTEVLKLAARVSYKIDPDNDYLRNYSGRIVAILKDGTTRTGSQPYLRGGIERKFVINLRYGGCSSTVQEPILTFADALGSNSQPVALPQIAC